MDFEDWADDEFLSDIEAIERTYLSSKGNVPTPNHRSPHQNNVWGPSVADPVPSASTASPCNTHHSFTTPKGYLEHKNAVEDPIDFDTEAGSTWIYPINYPLRDYQFNIVQEALFKNTLVCLPTGLGKTFIAAVVMYNYYRWFPSAKIIFMAPTKPLADQQLKACFSIMGIPQEDMTLLTGNVVSAKRENLWKIKRIFFLTPQVVANDLSRGICPGTDIRCVVIDEAHKATGGHSYCQVLELLCQHTKHTRILALSATPGSDLQSVQQVIVNLLISHIEIRSEDSADIAPYTHTKSIKKIIVDLGERLETIKRLYFEVIGHHIKKLINLNLLYTRDETTVTKFQILKAREASRMAPPPGVTSFQLKAAEGTFALCITLYHALELLQQHGVRSFYTFLNSTLDGENTQKSAIQNEMTYNSSFKNFMRSLKKDYMNPTLERPLPSHPKMEKILSVVREHFESFASKGMDTRVIVFSQYRVSVMEITEHLSSLAPLVKPTSFLGQSSSSKGTKGNTQKEQIEVVNKFKSGTYNTLVATCVAEEGLDIGEVDLIICYDFPKSPIRSVQRMGRTGRKREGGVVVLLTKGKEESTYNSSQFQKRVIDTILRDVKKLERHLYERCPRMVPGHLQPQCQKLNMTTETYQVKAKATKKKLAKPLKEDGRIKSLFAAANGRMQFFIRKTKNILTPSELQWYKDTLYIEEGEIKKMSKPKMSLWDEDYLFPEANTISLGEYHPWQTRQQKGVLLEAGKGGARLVKLSNLIDDRLLCDSKTPDMPDASCLKYFMGEVLDENDELSSPSKRNKRKRSTDKETKDKNQSAKRLKVVDPKICLKQKNPTITSFFTCQKDKISKVTPTTETSDDSDVELLFDSQAVPSSLRSRAQTFKKRKMGSVCDDLPDIIEENEVLPNDNITKNQSYLNIGYTHIPAKRNLTANWKGLRNYDNPDSLQIDTPPDSDEDLLEFSSDEKEGEETNGEVESMLSYLHDHNKLDLLYEISKKNCIELNHNSKVSNSVSCSTPVKSFKNFCKNSGKELEKSNTPSIMPFKMPEVISTIKKNHFEKLISPILKCSKRKTVHESKVVSAKELFPVNLKTDSVSKAAFDITKSKTTEPRSTFKFNIKKKLSMFAAPESDSEEENETFEDNPRLNSVANNCHGLMKKSYHQTLENISISQENNVKCNDIIEKREQSSQKEIIISDSSNAIFEDFPELPNSENIDADNKIYRKNSSVSVAKNITKSNYTAVLDDEIEICPVNNLVNMNTDVSSRSVSHFAEKSIDQNHNPKQHSHPNTEITSSLLSVTQAVDLINQTCANKPVLPHLSNNAHESIDKHLPTMNEWQMTSAITNFNLLSDEEEMIESSQMNIRSSCDNDKVSEHSVTSLDERKGNMSFDLFGDYLPDEIDTKCDAEEEDFGIQEQDLPSLNFIDNINDNLPESAPKIGTPDKLLDSIIGKDEVNPKHELKNVSCHSNDSPFKKPCSSFESKSPIITPKISASLDRRKRKNIKLHMNKEYDGESLDICDGNRITEEQSDDQIVKSNNENSVNGSLYNMKSVVDKEPELSLLKDTQNSNTLKENSIIVNFDLLDFDDFDWNDADISPEETCTEVVNLDTKDNSNGSCSISIKKTENTHNDSSIVGLDTRNDSSIVGLDTRNDSSIVGFKSNKDTHNDSSIVGLDTRNDSSIVGLDTRNDSSIIGFRKIEDTHNDSSIVGFRKTKNTHNDSSIVGFKSNKDTHNDSSIVGFKSNKDTHNDSSIVGFKSNKDTHNDSSIVGFRKNEDTHNDSSIVGFKSNKDTHNDSSIVGFRKNEDTHNDFNIVGFRKTEDTHNDSSIVGFRKNEDTHNDFSIVGFRKTEDTHNDSSVVGFRRNTNIKMMKTLDSSDYSDSKEESREEKSSKAFIPFGLDISSDDEFVSIPKKGKANTVRPDTSSNRSPSPAKCKKKSSAASKFLLVEADVSSDEAKSSDEEDGQHLNQYEMSFVNDDVNPTQVGGVDMQEVYLRSVRSPAKAKPPSEAPKWLPSRFDVCSQMAEYDDDDSYAETDDSFVVSNDCVEFQTQVNRSNIGCEDSLMVTPNRKNSKASGKRKRIVLHDTSSEGSAVEKSPIKPVSKKRNLCKISSDEESPLKTPFENKSMTIENSTPKQNKTSKAFVNLKSHVSKFEDSQNSDFENSHPVKCSRTLQSNSTTITGTVGELVTSSDKKISDSQVTDRRSIDYDGQSDSSNLNDSSTGWLQRLPAKKSESKIVSRGRQGKLTSSKTKMQVQRENPILAQRSTNIVISNTSPVSDVVSSIPKPKFSFHSIGKDKMKPSSENPSKTLTSFKSRVPTDERSLDLPCTSAATSSNLSSLQTDPSNVSRVPNVKRSTTTFPSSSKAQSESTSRKDAFLPPTSPLILINSAEVSAGGCQIATYLRQTLKASVHVCSIKETDYILSTRMAALRFPFSTWSSTANKSRLVSRVQVLCSSYEKPVIIVEKNSTTGSPGRSVPRSRYLNTLECASLQVPHLKLLHSHSHSQTAIMLQSLAKRESEHSIPVPLTLIPTLYQRIDFYCSMPGVNYCSALCLSYNFPRVAEMLRSSPKVLSEKGMMPPATASALHKYINTTFRRDMIG